MTMAFDAPPGHYALASLDHVTGSAPLRFHGAISRHHRHLGELSAALRLAGVPSKIALTCVEAALASFQDGLVAAIAITEHPFDDRV